MIDKNLLRTFQLCDALSEGALEELMGALKVARVDKSNIIFKRGRPLDAYYFLVSGKVNLIDNQFNTVTFAAGEPRASQPINADSSHRVSAIAATPVTMIVLDIERYNAVLAGQHQLETAAVVDPFMAEGAMGVAEVDDGNDWAASLLSSPLFRAMSSAQLHHLFSRFETCQVAAGERIIREGAAAEYFYVLTEGRARVYDRSGDVDVVLSPGDAFGDEALVSGAPRNATVEMLEAGAVKRLSAADFEQLVAEPALNATAVTSVSDVQAPARVMDVRLPLEYRLGHVPGSVNLPLTRLRRDLPKLSSDLVYLVPDSAGCRARTAVYLLRKAGYAARLLRATAPEPALQTA